MSFEKKSKNNYIETTLQYKFDTVENLVLFLVEN